MKYLIKSFTFQTLHCDYLKAMKDITTAIYIFPNDFIKEYGQKEAATSLIFFEVRSYSRLNSRS